MQTGWLGIRIMCPSGATCLPADSCFTIKIQLSVFRSFRCAALAKRHSISITRGRSPGLSQERM
jgi:hypothetical protein